MELTRTESPRLAMVPSSYEYETRIKIRRSRIAKEALRVHAAAPGRWTPAGPSEFW